MRLASQAQTKVDEENPYWISFSDLMSALLVIFILAALALIIELTQKSENIDVNINKLKKAEQARKDVVTEIKNELAKQNIKVEIVENETVIRIPEQTLSFDPGEDLIPNYMLDSVKSIGEILHAAIMKEERFRQLNTVFIEGHTDSQKITKGKYWTKGNWGLSADRAITVWKLWSEELSLTPELNSLQNHSGIKLFSVSGYAATRRLENPDNTYDKRSRNRRIDIRFTVKKVSIEDIEGIKAAYGKKLQGN